MYLAPSVPVSIRWRFPATLFKRFSAFSTSTPEPHLLLGLILETHARTVCPRVHCPTHSCPSQAFPRSTCLNTPHTLVSLPMQPSCLIFSTLTFPRMPHTRQMSGRTSRLSYLLTSSSRPCLCPCHIEDLLKQRQDFPPLAFGNPAEGLVPGMIKGAVFSASRQDSVLTHLGGGL